MTTMMRTVSKRDPTASARTLSLWLSATRTVRLSAAVNVLVLPCSGDTSCLFCLCGLLPLYVCTRVWVCLCVHVAFCIRSCSASFFFFHIRFRHTRYYPGRWRSQEICLQTLYRLHVCCTTNFLAKHNNSTVTTQTFRNRM